MWKKHTFIFFMSLVLFLTDNALAATIRDWDNGDPSGNQWNLEQNWDPDGEPNSSELAVISDGGVNSALIDSSVSAYCNQVYPTCVRLPVDFNWDLRVDFNDFSTLASAWRSNPNDGSWNPDVDLWPDGVVNELDLEVFTWYWLHPCIGQLDMTGGSLSALTSINIGAYADSIGEFNLYDGDVNTSQFFIGQNGTGTLNMHGGTIIADFFRGGFNETGSGIYNMYGGDANFAADPCVLTTTWVGYKGTFTLNMFGGAITFDTTDIPRYSTGFGHIQLDGGTIYVADRVFMRRFGGTGTIDISDGNLIVLNRNWVSTLQGYETNGWITAYGGGGEVEIVYDGNDTIMYATPP